MTANRYSIIHLGYKSMHFHVFSTLSTQIPMVFRSQVATDSPSSRLRLLTQCLMRHSQVSPAQQAEATQPDLIA